MVKAFQMMVIEEIMVISKYRCTNTDDVIEALNTCYVILM